MNIAWNLSIAALWILSFSYFRYRAARAETPAGEEWMPAFVGLGWARGKTVKGRRYRNCAWAALVLGAALFFFFPLHPCSG